MSLCPGGCNVKPITVKPSDGVCSPYPLQTKAEQAKTETFTVVSGKCGSPHMIERDKYWRGANLKPPSKVFSDDQRAAVSEIRETKPTASFGNSPSKS